MAHSFITNKDRLLSDIITGILPKSDAVDRDCRKMLTSF